MQPRLVTPECCLNLGCCLILHGSALAGFGTSRAPSSCVGTIITTGYIRSAVATLLRCSWCCLLPVCGC